MKEYLFLFLLTISICFAYQSKKDGTYILDEGEKPSVVKADCCIKDRTKMLEKRIYDDGHVDFVDVLDMSNHHQQKNPKKI